MDEVEGAIGQHGPAAVRVGLEDLDVGEFLAGDEVPRAAQLQGIAIKADHAAAGADPARERPEQAHRAAAQVETAPPHHRAEQVEPCLRLGLPTRACKRSLSSSDAASDSR